MILVLAPAGTRMQRMLRPINLRIVVLIIVMVSTLASRAVAQAASPTDNGHTDRAAPDHPSAAVHNHSVKLSWGPSKPASKSARDAVIGYNVYRSTVSRDPNPKRINSTLCPGTTYDDPDVEAGKTYFYVTRGVNANRVESAPSNEAKVVMPPQ